VTGYTGAIPPVYLVLYAGKPQRLYGLGGLYICHPRGISRLLEFKEVTNTPKNISKASKSLVFISLALNTL